MIQLKKSIYHKILKKVLPFTILPTIAGSASLFYFIFYKFDIQSITYTRTLRRALESLSKNPLFKKLTVKLNKNELERQIQAVALDAKARLEQAGSDKYQVLSLAYRAADENVSIEIPYTDKKMDWLAEKTFTDDKRQALLENGFFTEQYDILKCEAPAFDPDSEEMIGVLSASVLSKTPKALDVPLTEFNLRLGLWIFSSIVFFTFQLVAIVVVTKKIIGQILEPLTRLVKATKQISKGEYAIQIQKFTKDEVGELVDCFNDMTKNLRQQKNIERRYSDLVKTSTDWIWEMDEAFNYTYTNSAVQRILGYEPDEVLTLKVASIFHDSRVQESFAEVMKTQGVINTTSDCAVRKDGSPCYLDTSAVAAFNSWGKVVGIRGISRDVTNERETQEEQIRLHEEIRQVNKDVEKFVYAVSHDLKRPLIGMQSLIKLLSEKSATGPDAEFLDYLGRLNRCAKTMSEIIQGLVEVSKIGRVDMEPQWIDVKSLVEDLILEMRIREETKKIVFEIVEPIPEAWCNEKRLKQILGNLLDNAVKFIVHETEQPIIKIGANLTKENMIAYYVSDNGPGIDAKYHDSIFEIFQRLHGDRVPGTGMGLHFIKKIVERYGGKIWIESSRGAGATFHFALPIPKTVLHNVK
jgi:PAS domain S-box-containing protein